MTPCWWTPWPWRARTQRAPRFRVRCPGLPGLPGFAWSLDILALRRPMYALEYNLVFTLTAHP